MRKYLAIIKYKLLQTIQFRAEIVVWVFLELIPFGVMFLVLRSMYQGNWLLRTYNSSDMIQYYLMVVAVQALISTHFEGWRIEEIKNGKIDGYLLKPLSYLREIIITDLTRKLFHLAVFIPIYFLFFQVVQWISPFELPSVNFSMIWIFVMLVGFGYLVELSIAVLIVLLGFWFEGSQGLEHFKWITISLFSGSMVPLEFLPDWLRSVAAYLPFRYLYAVPINLIQSRYILSASDLIVMVSSGFILLCLVKLTFKKALLKYSSSGG